MRRHLQSGIASIIKFKQMKRIWLIGSLLWLLGSCNPVNPFQQPTRDAAKCPQSSPSLSELTIQPEDDFYSAFDYQIRNIEADTNIIRFQSNNFDFVFCRRDRSWTIQPGSLENKATEFKYEEYIAQLANSPYQTVKLNGKSYRYRVTLDPNPFPNFQQEAQQVILELIASDEEKPQRQVLYTLKQTQQARAGDRLGVPEITATLTYDNRLFWAISPEQGEGNGGIATIAIYNPVNREIAVIQPKEIQRQQINHLAIAGEPQNPTFWLATQMSGEGNPYLPSLGLVAYHPNSSDYRSGVVSSYRIENSPLVGAIPTQLKLERDWLWVSTGNGICQLEWQAADTAENWSCWRFALKAEIPEKGLPIYSSLLSDTPKATLLFDKQNPVVEVLWWLPTDFSTKQGRYEIKYEPGFTVELENQGAIPWSEFYHSDFPVPDGKPPVFWTGREWHWEGRNFVRGFDEVSLNLVGGGPMGIGSQEFDANNLRDMNAIRGDLNLLDLTRNTTRVNHYSAWVDSSLLKPCINIIPHQYSRDIKPNPLTAIAKQL